MRKAFSIALSFAMFSKPFTPQYLFGGAVVVAGIYVNLAAKNKNFSVEAGLKNLEMISKRFFREKASKKVDV